MRDFSTRPQGTEGPRLHKALVAVAAIALAWSAYSAFAARQEVSRRRATVDHARRDLQASQARLKALESRSKDLALAQQSLLTLDAPPPRVLATLAELMPADVRLSSVSLRYGDRLDVQMQVVARSAKAYDTFLERLQSSPAFESVLPGDENRDGEVRATVRAGYRGSVS
jgi:type IV pilus assembly PilN-like protein